MGEVVLELPADLVLGFVGALGLVIDFLGEPTPEFASEAVLGFPVSLVVDFAGDLTLGSAAASIGDFTADLFLGFA